MRIKGSTKNQIFENYFNKNSYGIYFCCAARNNRAHNNTFINNSDSNAIESTGLINHWYAESDPYGNYWDDYTGVDEDNNGIGDTDYSIKGSGRLDFYPLMEPVDVDYYFIDRI